MKVTVTFRHMESDPALRSYVEEKVTRIAEKYFHRPAEGQAILSAEKFRRTAEITAHGDNQVLTGKEEKEDMRSAIDLALEKLEKQAEKHRKRYKMRKRETAEEISFAVYRGKGPEPADEATEPRVIKTDRFTPKPMDVDDAVLLLSESKDDFIVFRDADSLKICVLYRREDGHYGLIEPEE